MQFSDTKIQLINLLLDIADGERQIEILRQILCEQKGFEPYAAFQRIDRSNKKSITISDILTFLSDNHITHTEEYCSVFLKRYDLDSDHRLDYFEFLRVVLPLNNPWLRAKATQRENYEVDKTQYLSYEIEYALAKVLDKEISFYLQIDPPKISLTQSPDYNNLEAFTLIDIDGSGRISFSNLKRFFQKEEVFPSDDDIVAIITRLDKHGDGLIPFEGFAEAMQPLNFSSETLVDRLKFATMLNQPNSKSIYLGTSTATKTSPMRLRQSVGTPERGYSGSMKTFASADRSGKMTVSMLERERTPVKQMVERYPATVSASKYRKEVSPYRRSGVYSEKGKSRGDYGSLVGRREIEREDTKENGYLKGKVSSFESRLEKDKGFISKSPYKRERSPYGKSGKKGSGSKGMGSVEEENYKAALDMFRSFVELDKEIEGIKKEMMMQADLNLTNLFQSFDIRDRGRINNEDLREGMERYGIYPDNEELYLFMRRFDRKSQNELSYSSFVEVFKPVIDEGLETRDSRIQKIGQNKADIIQIFSGETRGLVRKILRVHLENEKVAETLRQGLSKRVGFSPRQVFNLFDRNNDGLLDKEVIKLALEEKDIYLMKKELELLMNRLDRSRKGRVSYVDFVLEISPKN